LASREVHGLLEVLLKTKELLQVAAAVGVELFDALAVGR